MKENFDKAFEFAMYFEGYKSIDPDDPGGRTIFGISERSWPNVVPALWNLPYGEALAAAEVFYREEYWEKAGCDTLKWPDDVFVFDTAINLGLSKTAQLQVAAQDSFDFLMLRIEHYISISAGKNIKFLRGWIRRVAELYRRTP